MHHGQQVVTFHAAVADWRGKRGARCLGAQIIALVPSPLLRFQGLARHNLPGRNRSRHDETLAVPWILMDRRDRREHIGVVDWVRVGTNAWLSPKTRHRAHHGVLNSDLPQLGDDFQILQPPQERRYPRADRRRRESSRIFKTPVHWCYVSKYADERKV